MSQTHDRFIGVDYGTRHVGVAVGEDGIAVPHKTFTRATTHELLKTLSRLAETERASGFVLGVPLRFDGQSTPFAESVRKFGARLAERSDLPVHYEDEQLTSFMTQEKNIHAHARAAQLILEQYLHAHAQDSHR